MSRLPLVSPAFGLVTMGDDPAVSLHTPAWQCVNSYLLTDPAPKRRKRQVRPGVPGQFSGQSRPDIWTVELEIAVTGHWAATGLIHADPEEGAEVNWRYLLENVYDQAEDAQGRIAVSVTSAILGATYEGFVQVESFRREPIANAACCYLEVTLPSGGLTFTPAA